jgi:hypothetical protein
MHTLQAILVKFYKKLKCTQSLKTSDLYVLNWKSSYDVMYICAKVVNNISQNFNLSSEDFFNFCGQMIKYFPMILLRFIK